MSEIAAEIVGTSIGLDGGGGGVGGDKAVLFVVFVGCLGARSAETSMYVGSIAIDSTLTLKVGVERYADAAAVVFIFATSRVAVDFASSADAIAMMKSRRTLAGVTVSEIAVTGTSTSSATFVMIAFFTVGV